MTLSVPIDISRREHTGMLKEGNVVTGKVLRIEQYGIYLEHKDSIIVVLGPDASPSGDVPVSNLFKAGDEVRVQVGRYNQSDNVYRGYLK